MLPLFDINQINNVSSSTELPFKCEFCLQTFYKQSKYIKSYLKRNINGCRFCNSICANKFIGRLRDKKTDMICSHCNKLFKVRDSDKKRSKSGHNFCSSHCSAVYNNTHKTIGNRRSKLEIWIEQELTKQYPTLEIKYNDKETIKSELDIYIPSLNLAFELNGIFHYEPIYGKDKLLSIQNNDNRKFQACLEQDIELVIIDSSQIKHFKPRRAQKYIDIIDSIITLKLWDKQDSNLQLAVV